MEGIILFLNSVDYIKIYQLYLVEDVKTYFLK